MIPSCLMECVDQPKASRLEKRWKLAGSAAFFDIARPKGYEP